MKSGGQVTGGDASISACTRQSLRWLLMAVLRRWNFLRSFRHTTELRLHGGRQSDEPRMRDWIGP